MKRIVRETVKLMGNQFTFAVVQEDQVVATNQISKAIAEVSRIERLLTTFADDSATNRINSNAGIAPVVVGPEVFGLIERSLKISELTQGAFDITYGSIDKSLWNFDVGMKTLPDPGTAASMVRLINYRNVILNADSSTVFLKEKGMRIGFGGIGKGYAADRAKQVLVGMGVTSGFVNASGDISLWGTQPDGQPWTIGIADPGRRDLAAGSLMISDAAVATSGNYEKFVNIGGKRYSHTIDPRTGYPAEGISSVTIICPSAELADALATPVTVMGVRSGLHLINQLKYVECIIIADDGSVHVSANIKFNQ